MLLFTFIIFEAADGPELVYRRRFDMGLDPAIYHWELPADLPIFAFWFASYHFVIDYSRGVYFDY